MFAYLNKVDLQIKYQYSTSNTVLHPEHIKPIRTKLNIAIKIEIKVRQNEK